jgi:hypothetical protein
VQLPAHYGILLVLAATGTGGLLGWSVKFAMASSSGESITSVAGSSIGAEFGANPRRDESNQSIPESGAVTSHPASRTPADRTPPSAPASAPGQGPVNERVFPTGMRPMPQAQVTAEMTAWATAIVESKGTYPMGSTTTEVFGDTAVMARVEWHPPNLRHNTVHRGVTLYRAAMDDVAMAEPLPETDRSVAMDVSAR